MTDDLRAWVALGRVPAVGGVLLRRLLRRFVTPGGIVGATERQLGEVEGIGQETARAMAAYLRDPRTWEEIDREIWGTREAGGEIIALSDPRYPAHLSEIPDPPPYLVVKGDLKPADKYAVAMVGSREASEYGRRMAAVIAGGLAKRGITVVSGGARGIDASAHGGALRAGGRTVAVLGSGIDVPYPAGNRPLFERIARHGAVVTEFPLGTKPERGHFPRRNRIISGMSLGVIVVEAAVGSGSLITARAALDQGREVFAVPGKVGTPTAQGTHQLIRAGAVLVERAEEVIEELAGVLDGFLDGVRDPDPVPRDDLSPLETALLSCLDREPQHVDFIQNALKLPAPKVLEGLLGLELKGVARQLPGSRFVLE